MCISPAQDTKLGVYRPSQCLFTWCLDTKLCVYLLCLSPAQYRVDIGALCLFTACLQGCMRIEERLGSMRIEARLHARGPACHGMQHGVLHSGVQHAVLSRSNRARCLLSAVVTHVNMLVCVRCNACQGTACPACVRRTACQVCVPGNACQEP